MAKDMPLPHNAALWWDPEALAVGTGEDGSSYLYQARIILQLEIASEAVCPKCGTIGREPPARKYGARCEACKKRLGGSDAEARVIDARCWIEDEDMSSEEAKIYSCVVVDRLKGKFLQDAVTLPFKEAGGVLELIIKRAVVLALRDWGGKINGRMDLLSTFLPPEPKAPKPTVLRRLFSRVGL